MMGVSHTHSSLVSTAKSHISYFSQFFLLFFISFSLQKEEHQLGSTATDNQKEGAIATTAAPPTTSNSPSEDLLNKEQNPTYLEQMKEIETRKEKQDKKRSNPLSTTATRNTPQRTIKVTPSKSMKYYEVSREKLLYASTQAIFTISKYMHFSFNFYS